MQNITNSAELKSAIELLEVEHSINGQLLKKQFQNTYESLTPLKIIENTLRNIASSPFIGNNILTTTLGMTAGLLTRKVAVGKSGNVFRNLFGSFMQLGITKLISQNPETVKNIGKYLFEKIQSKKESGDEMMD